MRLLSVLAICGLFACQVAASEVERRSTATDNVQILSAMAMPGLDRDRVIRLYLPPGYHEGSKRYPVLYMHDGQNLFDDVTSFVGEWGVDESLNKLAQQGLELIVVGIDNGGEKRMNELSPWSHPDFLPAEGEQYTGFIVETLKPYIDNHYRTVPDRANTAIMGSSMGGLISHYAIHQYPQVFSKAGIFSPSYWFSDDAYLIAKQKPLPKDAKLYLLVGDQEGDDMVEGLTKMTASFKQQHTMFASDIIAGGEHNEALWKAQFPKAVTWLFAD